MISLRKQIQEIIDKKKLTVSELTALGLKQLADPKEWNDFEININCHAYAFGLDESSSYCKIAHEDALKETNKFFADGCFIKTLLSSQKELQKPKKDCLIVYFDDTKKPTHSGIVVQTSPSIRVRSKFGNIAIFEHEVLSETPEMYGNDVKYYLLPNLATSEKIFLKYVRSLGHN